MSNLVFQDIFSTQFSYLYSMFGAVLQRPYQKMDSSTQMKTKTNKKDLVENCDRTFRHDDNLD